jgi:hypothetical protein
MEIGSRQCRLSSLHRCNIGLPFDESLCTIFVYLCAEMMVTGHGRISQDAWSIMLRTFVHHEKACRGGCGQQNDIFRLSKFLWSKGVEVWKKVSVSVLVFSFGSPFLFSSCSFFGARNSFQDTNANSIRPKGNVKLSATWT